MKITLQSMFIMGCRVFCVYQAGKVYRKSDGGTAQCSMMLQSMVGGHQRKVKRAPAFHCQSFLKELPLLRSTSK